MVTNKRKRGRVLNLINGIHSLQNSGLSTYGVLTIKGLNAHEMQIVRDQLKTEPFEKRSEIMRHGKGAIIFELE